MSDFTDALNAQIASEFAASQQYVAIAVHYDAQTLPQLAAHFYRQAVEERNHAMMMVQYLLDADQPVITPAVEAPRTSFADDREPSRSRSSRSRRSPSRSPPWCNSRARRTTTSASTFSAGSSTSSAKRSRAHALLAVIDRAGTDHMLLVEDFLARSGGVTADAPSSPAPPAAGGAL